MKRNPWNRVEVSEEKLKYKPDLSFVAYCDFETTTTPSEILQLENSEVFVISYVIIFAFHSNLNLDRVVIGRSFRYGLQKLADPSYLKHDMLAYTDRITMQELRDSAIIASRQKGHNQAISEMFTTKLFDMLFR